MKIVFGNVFFSNFELSFKRQQVLSQNFGVSSVPKKTEIGQIRYPLQFFNINSQSKMFKLRKRL